jgi:hypothetical protein
MACFKDNFKVIKTKAIKVSQNYFGKISEAIWWIMIAKNIAMPAKKPSLLKALFKALKLKKKFAAR